MRQIVRPAYRVSRQIRAVRGTGGQMLQAQHRREPQPLRHGRGERPRSPEVFRVGAERHGRTISGRLHHVLPAAPAEAAADKSDLSGAPPRTNSPIASTSNTRVCGSAGSDSSRVRAPGNTGCGKHLEPRCRNGRDAAARAPAAIEDVAAQARGIPLGPAILPALACCPPEKRRRRHSQPVRPDGWCPDCGGRLFTIEFERPGDVHTLRSRSRARKRSAYSEFCARTDPPAPAPGPPVGGAADGLGSYDRFSRPLTISTSAHGRLGLGNQIGPLAPVRPTPNNWAEYAPSPSARPAEIERTIDDRADRDIFSSPARVSRSWSWSRPRTSSPGEIAHAAEHGGQQIDFAHADGMQPNARVAAFAERGRRPGTWRRSLRGICLWQDPERPPGRSGRQQHEIDEMSR